MSETGEVVIRWSAEDVMSLRPDLTKEQAEELLMEVSRSLKDRSIEQGWEILETLVQERLND